MYGKWKNRKNIYKCACLSRTNINDGGEKILNDNTSKFLKNNLQLFVITNNFLIIAFMSTFIDAKVLFTEAIATIVVLIMMIEAMLIVIFTSKYSNFIIKSIFLLIFLMWQYITGLNNSTRYIGIIFQPLILYSFIIFSVENIFYGNTGFKKNIDVILLFFSICVLISYFFDVKYFYFLYFLQMSIMYIYPITILIYCRKQISNLLPKMKINIIIFELYLIVDFMLAYFIEEKITWIQLDNLGWYVSTFIVTYIIFIKEFHKIIFRKANYIEYKYFSKNNILCVFIFSILFILYVNLLFKLNFAENYFIISISVMAFTTYYVFKHNINKKEYISTRDNFSSRSNIIDYIEGEEEMKSEIASYLHDEVLQNVIAVKNMLHKEELKYFNDEIHENVKTIIETLRNEIDFYHPVISKHYTLRKNYEDMMNEILSRYHSNKEINFICDELMVLMKPYDILIYRFLRELVNNSAKYSQGYIIEVKLKVSKGIIFLEVFNQDSFNVNINYIDESKGNGLRFMREQIEILNGDFNISKDIEKKGFRVSIKLPMIGEKCYENFIS